MLHSSWHRAACNARSKKRSPSRLLLLATLGATVFASGCSQSHQPGQNSASARPKTEAPAPFSAEMWLNWDKPSRIAFILGNLRGYSDGLDAGCGDAKRAIRSIPGLKGFTPEAADRMGMDCGASYKPSNRTLQSYEETITDFYTRYPAYRTVEIQEVLLLLAGDASLTAADIHERIKITPNPQQ